MGAHADAAQFTIDWLFFLAVEISTTTTATCWCDPGCDRLFTLTWGLSRQHWTVHTFRRDRLETVCPVPLYGSLTSPCSIGGSPYYALGDWWLHFLMCNCIRAAFFRSVRKHGKSRMGTYFMHPAEADSVNTVPLNETARTNIG